MSTTTQPPKLFTVHGYTLNWELRDKVTGGLVAEGPATMHTTEHHDDHGGTDTLPWLEHVHEIVAHAISAAVQAGPEINSMVLHYKNFQYIRKELQPYTRKVFGIICNFLQRRTRR